MDKQHDKQLFKIGVRQGGGPPPGYRWHVHILAQVFTDARFLNRDQYDHLALQVRELATQEDPTHSLTVDVRPVEDFYEIRDKGGILCRLNVRVFYFVHKESRAIVVLGVIKKENDGQTPLGDKFTMRRRKRNFLGTRGP